MLFSIKKLEIPDVLFIEPESFQDARGFFMETYHQKDFEKAGMTQNFVQDNHSRSKKGVVRGLHYQNEPMAQGKLVRCVRGTVFDVAVDLRKESPTYTHWLSVTLSEINRFMLWIPRGFAHGYMTLQDDAEVIYKVDNFYSPQHERGIIWNDPDLGIKWPVQDPIVSEKDNRYPKLKEADYNFRYMAK